MSRHARSFCVHTRKQIGQTNRGMKVLAMQIKHARRFWVRAVLLLAVLLPSLGSSTAKSETAKPRVYFSDTSRLGRPFAKDPSVIKFHGLYWMYYSIPAASEPKTQMSSPPTGWGIGIAQSKDLVHWTKVGELAPTQEIEKAGIAAPGARVIDGKVHLFYQTYGAQQPAAICHATSSDGIHFDHDPSNPVYHPTKMAWSSGRAIDAEVFVNGEDVYLLFATRDTSGRVQELGLAAAPLHSDLGRATWQDISIQGPILKPELPWEQSCIEAPSVLQHGKLFYLFYAGAYNNQPQQIGVASSADGRTWTRLSDQPLLPNGAPGSWNSSESGHPGVFTDDDGRTYLFYQGNQDNGRTWSISMMEITWDGNTPRLVEP